MVRLCLQNSRGFLGLACCSVLLRPQTLLLERNTEVTWVSCCFLRWDRPRPTPLGSSFSEDSRTSEEPAPWGRTHTTRVRTLAHAHVHARPLHVAAWWSAVSAGRVLVPRPGLGIGLGWARGPCASADQGPGFSGAETQVPRGVHVPEVAQQRAWNDAGSGGQSPVPSSALWPCPLPWGQWPFSP